MGGCEVSEELDDRTWRLYMYEYLLRMTVRTLTMIHASRVRSSSIAIPSCEARSKIARKEIVSNEQKST
jgi:hypothetical protein